MSSFGPAAVSSGELMSLPRCRPRSCVRVNSSMPHDPELVAETRAWLAKQAVEKSFKALLTWHGKQSLGVEPELRAIVDSAVPLTDYAWKFRYPGDPEAPSRVEAQNALAIA